MNPEKIQVLAQLMSAMEEAVGKMEKYYEKKDLEKLKQAKVAILEMQKRIAQILDEK